MVINATYYNDKQEQVCNLITRAKSPGFVGRAMWTCIKVLGNIYDSGVLEIIDGEQRHLYYNNGLVAFADMMIKEFPDRE